MNCILEWTPKQVEKENSNKLKTKAALLVLRPNSG